MRRAIQILFRSARCHGVRAAQNQGFGALQAQLASGIKLVTMHVMLNH